MVRTDLIVMGLIADPEYAPQVTALKERFWKTRTFYDDTDEEVWKRGGGDRFAAEDYIRPRKPKK